MHARILTHPFFYCLLSILVVAMPLIIEGHGVFVRIQDLSGHTSEPVVTWKKGCVTLTDADRRGRFFATGPYQIHLTTDLFIMHPDRYRFSLSARGRATLAVAGTPLVRLDEPAVVTSRNEGIFLGRGFHRLRIDVIRETGPIDISVRMRRSNHNEFQDIPRRILFMPTDQRIRAVLLHSLAAILTLLWTVLGVIHIRSFQRRGLISLRRLAMPLIVLFPAVGFLLLLWHDMGERTQEAVHGCDSYGYLQAALRMEEAGPFDTFLHDEAIPAVSGRFLSRIEQRQLMFFQAPHAHHIVDFDRGVLANQYPPGFPFILRIAHRLNGERAIFLVSRMASLLTLILLFMVCRRMLPFYGNLAGLGLLAAQPLFFEYSILLMSDMVSISLLSALLLIVMNDGPARSRDIVLIGILGGVALTIRYSNLLFLVIPAIWLLRQQKRFTLSFLSGGVFAICGVLPLMFYQKAVTGSFFQVTYNFTNTGKLSLNNIPTGLPFYLHSLYTELDMILLVGCLPGILLGLTSRKLRMTTLACLIFSVGHVLFISANSVLLERYLLPLLPMVHFFFMVSLGALVAVVSQSNYISVYEPTLSGREYLPRNGPAGEMTEGRCGVGMAGAITVSILLVVVLISSATRQRSEYPCGADRTPAEISWRIAAATPPHARILCDDLSGSLRIYGSRYGYRLSWFPRDMLPEAVNHLLNGGWPVFLLIDCPELQRYQEYLEQFFTLERRDCPLPFFEIRQLDSTAHTSEDDTIADE